MNDKILKDETKELNEQDTEKVTGGFVRPFHPVRVIPPEERPEHDEKKDGGATGEW